MKYLKSKYAQIKACFIAFVISRFTPDYEKIKAENKELKQDIYNLIRKENEVEGMTVKMRWKIAFDTDDMIWFGDSTKTGDKFQGLFSQISTNPNGL
jgi:Txe/YoeB family toxin of Txe-Axe toxin-antitoxin module